MFHKGIIPITSYICTYRIPEFSIYLMEKTKEIIKFAWSAEFEKYLQFDGLIFYDNEHYF